MIALEAIAALNSALSQTGQTIRLLRMASPPATGILAEVTCLANLTGYAPSELVQGSGITQQDQKLILSPTPLLLAGWPGSGSPVPRQRDRVVSNRGALTVQAAVGFWIEDILVRIEAQVRGD